MVRLCATGGQRYVTVDPEDSAQSLFFRMAHVNAGHAHALSVREFDAMVLAPPDTTVFRVDLFRRIEWEWESPQWLAQIRFRRDDLTDEFVEDTSERAIWIERGDEFVLAPGAIPRLDINQQEEGRRTTLTHVRLAPNSWPAAFANVNTGGGGHRMNPALWLAGIAGINYFRTTVLFGFGLGAHMPTVTGLVAKQAAIYGEAALTLVPWFAAQGAALLSPLPFAPPVTLVIGSSVAVLSIVMARVYFQGHQAGTLQTQLTRNLFHNLDDVGRRTGFRGFWSRAATVVGDYVTYVLSGGGTIGHYTNKPLLPGARGDPINDAAREEGARLFAVVTNKFFGSGEIIERLNSIAPKDDTTYPTLANGFERFNYLARMPETVAEVTTQVAAPLLSILNTAPAEALAELQRLSRLGHTVVQADVPESDEAVAKYMAEINPDIWAKATLKPDDLPAHVLQNITRMPQELFAQVPDAAKPALYAIRAAQELVEKGQVCVSPPPVVATLCRCPRAPPRRCHLFLRSSRSPRSHRRRPGHPCRRCHHHPSSLPPHRHRHRKRGSNGCNPPRCGKRRATCSTYSRGTRTCCHTGSRLGAPLSPTLPPWPMSPTACKRPWTTLPIDGRRLRPWRGASRQSRAASWAKSMPRYATRRGIFLARS